ncbi:tetratricopeptide repeat protein (macronuclear) [Tetrahymena thermophila SB210]|uniref:Tetratricopeptide repeat protein n=1 Tax=Tetrahymena thermophila (strain SB210) TaxID=312017 RepID=I7MMF2_TETTS|nr:tetratricopeptide repeat protein [Tetrahymena thermophila SB210]EAS04734.2 tetratricopeptide repeat protein [Tetrahymena thermophila SB210]|eukprot:XP_001024979.2 tetratricopeptide repeat protein [Tetrahymena thermophila SB210]
MGNQCCTSVRYSEAQFNEIQTQKAIQGMIEQPYFSSIDRYSFSCGQNRVVIMKGNTQISNKSVYEMCFLINDLFSQIEDQPHKLLITENLISFFRNNPKHITNKLVVDCLVELFSEQFSYQKITYMIEERNSRDINKNSYANQYGFGLNQQHQNGMSQSHSQQGLQNKYSQLGYQPINDQDQFGLPHYQTGYNDNSPMIANYDQFNQFSGAEPKEKIIDFEPNPSDIHRIYDMNQIGDNHRQMQFDEINQQSNQFLNEEEGQSYNYSSRVYNNPNTMYKSGFQSPRKQEDLQAVQTQLNQLQISTKRQPTIDQNILYVLEFVANKMGSYQLEQTSQKDIWQIWRVFDTSTGFMNYHKKYNLLQFSKQAMSIYQKEATVLQLIEDSQLNITPRLMKYDAKNKEIKFEGGYCTLWEYSIEMGKIQQRFSERDLIYITLELIRMVQDLQKLSIYHGNIKPQNIVLVQTAEGKFQIRLINFENCVRSQKDIYPLSKTESYYDIIHKFKLNSDIMSSQIYQIGRTVLNIIIKQGINTNQLHSRKNHPLISAEVLKTYYKEYPNIINLISKMLRQPSTNPNNNINQYQNISASKAASNLAERNKEEVNSFNQNASGEQTINSLSIQYSMQQLDRDLVQIREQMRSGQQQNFIHDVKNVVKIIGRRRVEMGAWDQSMTPDAFKREILYVLSLQQFERGCELCNYLLNFKSSPNYNLIGNNNSNNNNSSNNNNNSGLKQSGVNNNNSSNSNNNNNKYSQINNSNLNIQQQDPNNPSLIPYPLYLKKPIQTPLKQDLIKYQGYQHEFLVKAQLVLKQVYSKQLNEIIHAYFQVKEELSMYYFQNKMFNEAIKEQEDLVQEKKNLNGSDEISLSKSFRILGEIYLQANNYDKSIKSLAQSLYYITNKSNNLMHFQVAETLITMAEAYCVQNDSKRAIQSAMIAYDISSQTSPDSLGFAEICIQISSIFMRLFNDFGKAIPYFEKGVKIKINCFKETFLNQYLDLNILQLASYYEQFQNYAMAQEYYEVLLHIRQKRLPPKIISSPQVAQSHTLIGFVHEKMNQLDKAQENHQKALLMRKHLYGEVHQEVADSMINLSMVQIRKGLYQEALKMQEQALKIKEKLMPDSADVAQCMNNLAILLETLGNFESAISYHEKSIAIKKKIYGEQSSSIATSYNNLALTYQNSSQPEKAIPLFKNALLIREKLDQNSEEVVSVLNNLQAIYMDLGDYDQANQIKEKIVSIKKIISQKKEKRDLSKAREEELIYRTSNPSQAVFNQALVIKNQLNQQSQLNLSKLPINQQSKTQDNTYDTQTFNQNNNNYVNQQISQMNQQEIHQINQQLNNSINIINQNNNNQYQQQQSILNQQTNYSSQIPQTANFFSSNHFNQNNQSDMNQNILPVQPNSLTFTELNHFTNNNGQQDQNMQQNNNIQVQNQQFQQQQNNFQNSVFNNNNNNNNNYHNNNNNNSQQSLQQGSMQFNQQNHQQNELNQQQLQQQAQQNQQYNQQNSQFNNNSSLQQISQLQNQQQSQQLTQQQSQIQQQQKNQSSNIFLQKSQYNQNNQPPSNNINSQSITQSQYQKDQPQQQHQQFIQSNSQSLGNQQSNIQSQKIGENMKISNNNLQYQSNRPSQLQSMRDFNANNQRVE